jgi:hydroxyquinol 1,2-dioxygenase
VSGTIRSTDGEPLGGAMLDMWQSDAEGAYSPFDIPKDQASWNLRARVIDLERWQSRLLGIAGKLITVALVIGALVGRFRW